MTSSHPSPADLAECQVLAAQEGCPAEWAERTSIKSSSPFSFSFFLLAIYFVFKLFFEDKETF